MKILNIDISNTSIASYALDGAYNEVTLSFSGIPESWQTKLVYATFIQDNLNPTLQVIDGSVEVPSEILASNTDFYVGLYAMTEGETQVEEPTTPVLVIVNATESSEIDVEQLIKTIMRLNTTMSKLSAVATSGSYLDLSDTPVVDSSFNGESDNAQSGKAVAEAIAKLVESAPETLDTIGKLAAALGGDSNFATTIMTTLGTKVSKEEGKGLSANDYTDAEKQKLELLEEGAQVNVQPDWNESDAKADGYIKNKPILSKVAKSGDYNDLINKPDSEEDIVPIVTSASGENITITDSAEARLRGFKLYGKSEQNGTPSPDNPVEIVSVGDDGDVKVNVCGKNLLPDTNSVLEVGGSYTSCGVTWTKNADGTFVANGTATGGNSTIYLVGHSALLQSFTLPAGTYYTAPQVMLMLNDWKTYANGTLTLAKETTYMRAYLQILNGTTVSNLKIYPWLARDRAITVDTFEPYKGQTLTIPTPNGLPGIPVTSGGNYTDKNGQMYLCDEVDFESLEYVKNVDPVVFTDNIPHIFEYGSTDDVLQLATNMCDKFKQYSKVMCNYLMNGSAETKAKNTVVVSIGAARTYFRFDKTQFPTIDDAKAWFTSKYNEGNPMIVLGQLETPIRTPLTEDEIAAYKELCTHYPVTNITNDSGAGMEVKYVADTKMYIDSKIAEMKEELTAAIITE